MTQCYSNLLAKYNLAIVFAYDKWVRSYFFYLREDCWVNDWFYRNYKVPVDRLTESELAGMSEEQLEEFMIACAVKSMEQV